MNNETEEGTNILTGVACKAIRFNSAGVATHYNDKVWIKDENEPDGGTYQMVKKRFDKPKIEIEFVAEVNVDLSVGTTYQDNLGNLFLAISRNKIKAAVCFVDKFSIPTILIPISQPFNEA